jgi:Outer membrane protein beta-barrel domain
MMHDWVHPKPLEMQPMEDFKMGTSYRSVWLLLTALFCVRLGTAQTSFDINIGFGAIQDTASSAQVDQALMPCSGANDPYGPCVSTPSLSGFMLGFGGDLMLWKKLGVGANVTLQPAQQTFVNLNSQAAYQGLNSFSLNSRMILYDFDGVYEAVHIKRFSVKLRGGLGGANLRFYQSGSEGGSVIGTSDYSQYYTSANHFQVHGGLGLQAYVWDHVFVRPEFNVYYVTNLTQQFGRDLVTEEMVWLGYSWGAR